MTDIKPFADDSRVVTVGDLAIENGTGAIVIHGDIEIRRDRAGLDAARILRDACAAIVDTLEAQAGLPGEAPPARRSERTFDNPFGQQ